MKTLHKVKLLATAVAIISYIAEAADVAVNWSVGYVQVNPDGRFQRRAISVNGLPTPSAISANVGDTLVLTVQNNLDENTSVHFHGIFQNGTTYYDGPLSSNQCGIPPGQNFTYRVPIQQYGTYWAHSHKGSQYVDGFRTPLILHPPTEVHTYDEEMTVTISDWYHTESPILLERFLSQYNPSGAEPVPQSGLINFSRNSTLNFVPGKTYRLRFINMAAFSMFYVYLDGHQFDIIELDGVDVKRQTVDQFSISAAQRVSVLVTAKNSTDKNYLLHADMNVDMFDSVPSDLEPNTTSTVVYAQNASMFSSTPISEYLMLDDTTLSPVIEMASAKPDVSVTLNVTFDILNDGINHGTFNQIAFVPPNVPSIFTAMTMGNNATIPEIYGRQTHALVLKHNDMIELVINNMDPGTHPFHLHGHQFQIVYKNENSSYDPSTASMGNLSNPIRRDTVAIAGGGSTVLRFRADNPGVWLFHCHIEWHLESGLGLTLIEAPLQMQQNLTIPDQIIQQCHSQGIKTSGNFVGLNSTTDFIGGPYGPFPLPSGFTPKGIGALAACIIAAVCGMATVCWYALEDPLNDSKKSVTARAMHGSTMVGSLEAVAQDENVARESD